MSHLRIYCHKKKQQRCLAPAAFQMFLSKKNGIKETSVVNLRPVGSGSSYCCGFISDHCLTSPVCKWVEEKRCTSPGCELSLSVFFFFSFEWQKVPPSHEYQGQTASIIHNPAVLRCPYLHSYCRTSEWLSLFNIAAAAGPARAALGQQEKKKEEKGAHQWVAGWQIHKQDLVISYLLFELLSRVL